MRIPSPQIPSASEDPGNFQNLPSATTTSNSSAVTAAGDNQASATEEAGNFQNNPSATTITDSSAVIAAEDNHSATTTTTSDSSASATGEAGNFQNNPSATTKTDSSAADNNHTATTSTTSDSSAAKNNETSTTTTDAAGNNQTSATTSDSSSADNNQTATTTTDASGNNQTATTTSDSSASDNNQTATTKSDSSAADNNQTAATTSDSSASDNNQTATTTTDAAGNNQSSSAAAAAEKSESRSGTVTMTTAIEEQKNKRARRVSFAEMTSVYLFDRDDEDGTPSDGSAVKLTENEEERDEEMGDDSCSLKDESDEGEEDEEVDVRLSFFRPSESPSPGSNLGSATSNDEDHFFGPVSPSFIRPGRLSGSATSDNNHDITMDSTAFSMHFHSLARSELGEGLKTPTGINHSFGEKTPIQTTLGSSMVLTEVKKPIFKSDLHVANISGGSDSSDMSLVVENSRKYEYDRLLPGVDDNLAEVEKNLLVMVPGDRDSSDMSPEVEVSHKYESSTLLPGVGDILVEVDKNMQVNLVPGNSSCSRSPGVVSSKFLQLGEQRNDPIELNYQMQTTTAHPHNDIVTDRLLENQMVDANGGARTYAVCHPSDLVAPSLSPHPSGNIYVDNATVSSNTDKIVSNSLRTADLSALNHLAECDLDTKLTDSNVYKLQESEPLIQELTSSPPIKNKSIMDTLTASKYSMLVTPPQNQNAELPPGSTSSIQKSILKLEKLKTSSMSSCRNQKFSDSHIHHLEPPSDNFLDQHEKLSNFKKVGIHSRQEESQLLHSMELKRTSITRMSSSELRSKLSEDASQAIPGSASLSSGRNLTDSKLQKNLLECFEQSPSKLYVLDVNVPGDDHPTEVDNFVSLFHLTDEFKDSSACKRKKDRENISGDNKDEEILTMKNPKLQKISGNDAELLGCNGEVSRGTHTSSQELKRWTDIYAKFSEDTERLLPSAVDKLNSHAIDVMADVLASLQRSKSYMVTCDGILQQRTSAFNDIDSKRIVNARSLLQKILYERAKSQLMRLKRAKLQDKVQQLTSGILGSQMLKSSLSPLHPPTVAPVGVVCQQSLTVGNKEEKEVACDRVTPLLQHLEALNRKISDSLKKLQLSYKIKGEHSSEDTHVLVNECLKRKKRCRSIRLDIQLWDVHAAESRNGHHTFIVSYLDLVIQRLTIDVGTDSSIAIINKVDNIQISKKFPTMDALTAFKCVLNNKYSRKFIGLRSLAWETQVTSSMIKNLVDVVEEVQLAQIKIQNLTQTSFYSQSAEQLGLRLCFLNFKTVRKLTLTLDISCLKGGVYPADVSPSELAAVIDAKGSSCAEQVEIREIKNAVQNVRPGYMRILRLCRCISQATQDLVI